jgi:hypothetical protein
VHGIEGCFFHEVTIMKVSLALVMSVTLAGTPVAAQDVAASNEPGQAPASDQPRKDAAPEHAHTGWATLLRDTSRDFVAFPKRRSTWTLLGIGAASALAAHQGDSYVESHVVGNQSANTFFRAGKWVGSTYMQIGSGVGLWAVGRYVIAPATDESKTNRFSEIGFDLIRSQIVSQAVVHGMKYSIRRDRPTGECCSFPSGHAATAFAAASVLERHLGYRGSWPALAGATYVAASRLVDNRHFLSDVMMGAGVGMAAGWTVVGTQGRNEYAMQPVPVKGGMMIAFTRVRDQN